ncbi:hypothetical protein [Vibrio sp. HN007]|uniref:Npun_F0296 family exosortase-dependent surface protein n=1 Tax=Vibrio iocasae TaxID=3098914 RepID=UPI0035D503A0
MYHLYQALLLILLLVAGPAHAGLIFTIEAPGVQSSLVEGDKVIENFDDWSKGVISSNQSANFGTYYVEGKPKIYSARLWGGAGGYGNYMFVSPKHRSSITLELLEPAGYFGFWWSAGDHGNRLKVNTLSEEFDFTTSTIFDSLGNLAPYKGNPTDRFKGQNPGQPYGFINLFALSDDFKIESIMFYGSNFETDNHTIIREIQNPTGTTITSLASTNVTTIPEPSSLGLFGVCLILIIYMFNRRIISLD